MVIYECRHIVLRLSIHFLEIFDEENCMQIYKKIIVLVRFFFFAILFFFFFSTDYRGSTNNDKPNVKSAILLTELHISCSASSKNNPIEHFYKQKIKTLLLRSRKTKLITTLFVQLFVPFFLFKFFSLIHLNLSCFV